MNTKRKAALAATSLAAIAVCLPGFARAEDDSATTDAQGSQTVIVYVVSSARQGQTVTESVIAVSVPGVSPIKAVERLPGVNFQSADATGAYEWSTRITLRGFNQNQLGFTLDGVPLGDMSYGNHNGLHISRAIISENVGRIELSQGAGAVSTASTSNLGGTLQFFGRDPDEAFGGVVALTGGTENTGRLFARLETGELPGIGGALSVSGVMQRAEKWKGEGEQNQDQINLRYLKPILDDGSLLVAYNWSDRAENDYQDLSLEMIGRLGYDWDNISGDYDLAQRIAEIANNQAASAVGQPLPFPDAGLVFPAPIATLDDAYFDAAGLRKDQLTTIKLDVPVTETVRLGATVYNHTNEGQGIWFTPYVATPAGAPGPDGRPITAPAPTSVRTTEYDIARTGLMGSLSFDLGAHQLSFGFWTESNSFNQARRFYGLSRSGNIRPSLEFMTNPFFTQWEYDFETTTQVLWVQDVWDVSETLTVTLGGKNLSVVNEVTSVIINNGIPSGPAALAGRLETKEDFLPQVGFTWDVVDNYQVFGGWSRNVAAFVSAGTAGPFSSRNQTVIEEVGRTLNPERSSTFEVGVRGRGERWQAAAAAYVVRFSDRILGVSLGPGIVGAAANLSNVGKVDTSGFELVGTYELTDDIDVFASYAWNQSEYQSDIVRSDGTLVQATGGKTTVNTPEHLLRGEISYDNGSLFGKLSASYTSERFFSFENTPDGKVDGYTLMEAALGYRFGGSAFLEGLEVQLNATNLLDEEYVSTIGSNGFVRAGDSQTLLAGAPRQVMLTVRKAF
jgi:iron complex outermembrane recepter protein